MAEGTGVRVENKEQFRAWLEEKKPPKEICVALAARAALRALPIVVGPSSSDDGNLFVGLAATAFRATAIARLTAKYPARAGVATSGYASSAAHAAFAASQNARNHDIYAARAYVLDAARAAVDCAYSGHAEEGFEAATSAAAYAASAATRLSVSVSYWNALGADLRAFLAGGSHNFLDRPLWPINPPEAIADYWRRFADALPQSDGWRVWIRWYDARLKGEAWGEGGDLIYATVPVETWDEGPAAANAWIAERLAELDAKEGAQSDPPSVDDAVIERVLVQDPHGAPIEVVDGKAQIATSQNADDLAVAQEAQTALLHERVRARANIARDHVQRLANQLGFESISTTVDEFARLLAGDTQSVAANISSVWELSTAIGTFIERDNEVKAGRGGMTPQMDADARETLDQLLVAAAPFVRRFPTARQNDEEVREFRRTRESIEAPKRILQQAADENLIETHSNTIIIVATGAAERGEGIQAEKSRSWLSKTARNMIAALVLVSGIALSPVGKFADKIVEDFYDHSQSKEIIRKFLLEKEKDVIELFSDLPPDMRAALQEIYRRLREGKIELPPPDPTQRA